MASKGQKWKQSERDIRHEFIRKLLLRGFDKPSIMKALERSNMKIAIRTLNDDIRWLKANPMYVPEIDLNRIMDRSVVNMDDIRREYWVLFHTKGILNREKIDLLSKIQKWEVDRWGILEKAGLIAGGTIIGGGAEGDITMAEVLNLVDALIEICGIYVPHDRWDEFLIQFKQTALEFGREHPDDNDYTDIDEEPVSDQLEAGIIYLGGDVLTKEDEINGKNKESGTDEA